MYRVIDGGKPAKFPEHKVDESWDNCDFESKLVAVKYAANWLGINSPFMIADSKIVCSFHQREPRQDELDIFDKPYNYSGYGDHIQIIEI